MGARWPIRGQESPECTLRWGGRVQDREQKVKISRDSQSWESSNNSYSVPRHDHHLQSSSRCQPSSSGGFKLLDFKEVPPSLLKSDLILTFWYQRTLSRDHHSFIVHCQSHALLRLIAGKTVVFCLHHSVKSHSYLFSNRDIQGIPGMSLNQMGC